MFFCVVFLVTILLVIEFVDTKPGLSFYREMSGNVTKLGANSLGFDRTGQVVVAVGENSQEEELKPFEELVKNTEKLDGLFPIYRDKKRGEIYLEIKPQQLNKNYLLTIAIESGIGQGEIYRGMGLNDAIFYFRRVNNNLLFTLRNLQFRTRPGDPQQGYVNRSFSDSVLASLPIKSIHPQRQTILIELNELLLKEDLANLTSKLREAFNAHYQLEENKSYFGKVQVFPENLEVDSVYGFSLQGEEEYSVPIETLPDRRALTIAVHYSLSEMPENNGYVPRLADDRVGYFTTDYEDFSDNQSNSPTVRYIYRWRLEKQDPSAAISPPKKPIVFWIENTVPLAYRNAIKEGVLMWKKAFEKAGFKDAIEVRQMPDNATWNPADVRYNTIRWYAAVDAEFGRAETHVNPLTGEFLDADIIIDANLIRARIPEYRIYSPPNLSRKSLLNLCRSLPNRQSQARSYSPSLAKTRLCDGRAFVNQFAIGALSLSLLQNEISGGDGMKEYVHQFLREVIAHEVGHTLGLRHNFRASIFLKPEELNNTDITRTRGLSSSLMDYNGTNLAPQITKQGDYRTSIVGPYDEWAIEYGYKVSGAATPLAEKRFLEEIAQKQSTNPELSYAPDEDSDDIDPTVNQHDMSSDPLRYSQWQLDNARLMWDRLNKRYPLAGSSYDELSKMFDEVFGYYWLNVEIITKYIGGQSFYRDRAVSNTGRLPFEAVPVAKQREALTALQKYVFAEDALNFPLDLLNKLATSGKICSDSEEALPRLDYPVHDCILQLQSAILRMLLSGDRLNHLRDIELKSPPGQALTQPDLFNALQTGIWTEVLQPQNKQVKIFSLRRPLQREYVEILINMVLRATEVPQDSRTLAWEKLRQLREKLNVTLRKQSNNLDDYTKAHLEETRARITKALDAPLLSKSNDNKRN